MNILAFESNPETGIEINKQVYCNIEAEQCVLGVLLTQNTYFHRVSFLNANDFAEPLHQRIFEAISQRIRNGERADAILLKREFETDPALIDIGGNIYLHKLVSQSFLVTEVVSHAREIKRFSITRQLQMVLDEAQSRINENPSELAAFVTAEMLKLSANDLGNPAKSDYQITKEILQELQNESLPSPTGIEKLDKAMEGGMFPGKAYGFAARKKMGKTTLAATISYNLAKSGIKHMFICGEMGPHEIHQRQLARETESFASAFRTDYKHNLGFQNKLEKALKNSSKCIIYQNAPALTFDQLKHYVAKGINNYQIKGFILDYWQLVGGKKGKHSDAMHLDEVAQWIANTCRQHQVWALVTAQINQDGNTRGGEGIRLAFDQVYNMQAPGDDPSRSGRWLEMMDTRYTKWINLGSDESPALLMNEHGPYFEQV